MSGTDRARVELAGGTYGTDLAACSCPRADGAIRHQRDSCTDPVVARLGWYADQAAAAPATGLVLELAPGRGLVTPWARCERAAAEQWQAYARATPGGPTLLLTAFCTGLGEWRATAEFASHMGSWSCATPLPSRDYAQRWAQHQIEILGELEP